MVEWNKIDVGLIEQACLNDYQRYGCYPSIRDIFYSFVGILWPNTRSAYQGLSRWLTKLRLEGRIDWRIIRDGSGRNIEGGDIPYLPPEKFFEYWVNWFKELEEEWQKITS